MKILTFTRLLMLSVAFLSTSASAMTVTMKLEGMPRDQVGPFAENGFSVSAPATAGVPEAHLHAALNRTDQSTAAQLANDAAGGKIFKNDSGKFDLLSIDVLKLEEDGANQTGALHFDGFKNGAVATSKVLDAGTTGKIDFGAAFSDLDSVEFWFGSAGKFGEQSSLGSVFEFDNITLDDAVPEPPAPAPEPPTPAPEPPTPAPEPPTPAPEPPTPAPEPPAPEPPAPAPEPPVPTPPVPTPAPAPVPIPGAVWLFVSALSGLGIIRRKRSAA